MLTKMKLFALCAALAGGVGIAAAQPAPAPGSQPQQTQRSEKWAAKKAEMLAKYDTNKDGQISLDEFKAFAKSKHGHHARGGKRHHRGMGGKRAFGGGDTK